jgi:hypothetical protein
MRAHHEILTIADKKRRSILERWVANRDYASLLRQLSGFVSRHLSKIQNGRHKQRSGQHTLARDKIVRKKYFTEMRLAIISELEELITTY